MSVSIQYINGYYVVDDGNLSEIRYPALNLEISTFGDEVIISPTNSDSRRAKIVRANYLDFISPSGVSASDVAEKITELPVVSSDNARHDAFGRLRVSDPYTVFDSKELNGSGSRIWSEIVNGTATSVKDDDNSQYLLNAPNSGDYAIRQTKQRYQYQAGKSQLALLTGVLPTVADSRGLIGLVEEDQSTNSAPYEAYNGMYFMNSNDGTTAVDGMHVCVSKNGVHNRVNQNDWNIDRMDGNGPSNKIADWSKAQIFMIDFEWLGVGRVRFYLNIDGVSYQVHEFEHANAVSSVYVKSPNLPVRYEARSSGGNLTVQKICASIQSEGGVEQAGIMHIGSSQLVVVNDDTLGTDNTILAIIRLQSEKPYSLLKLLSFSGLTFSNAPLRWSIALVDGLFEIDVNGVPTAIDDLAGSIDLPETTINFWEGNTSGLDTVLEADISPYTIEEGFIGSGGNQSNVAAIAPAENLLTAGKSLDGSRTAFVLYAQGYGVNTMRYAIKFKEVL
jgi:hypothetical protein